MNDNPYQGPESQDDRSVINHPFAWILSAIFLVAGAAGFQAYQARQHALEEAMKAALRTAKAAEQQAIADELNKSND